MHKRHSYIKGQHVGLSLAKLAAGEFAFINNFPQKSQLTKLAKAKDGLKTQYAWSLGCNCGPDKNISAHYWNYLSSQPRDCVRLGI